MSEEDVIVELLRGIREDLQAIRRHTMRLARETYRKDLEKVASTPERQEMWRLFDGTLRTEEIAKMVGVTPRAVQYFTSEVEKLGLITFPRRGYPKRIEDFDIIPPEWKPYKRLEAVAQPNEAEAKKMGEKP